MAKRALTPDEFAYVDVARVCRLATASPEGVPHVVPLCPVATHDTIFILNGNEGEKPRKRTRNMLTNPVASVVFDHYSEDWGGGLGHVVITGPVEVLSDGPEHDRAQVMLREKFPQMRPWEMETWAVLAIRIEDVASWGSLSA